MMYEDGSEQWTRGGPPPIDEAWWEAVLRDEERCAPPVRRPGRGSGGGRENSSGSPRDWIWARQLYRDDETVELPVVGYNRGGLLVEARTLRGFVPVSHLVDVDPTLDESTRESALAEHVGRTICLKVIEYDPERGRLVLSERAAQAGPGRRLELLSSLQPGDRVRGRVTNITRFGVFVDLGGVEGLIHVSELSWGRVRHPSDVVTWGEEIEVHVLSIDSEQCRVALSLKELMPDPWRDVEERYNVGDIVEGVVTNVVKFGAFVGLEEGLEGLVHVSELGDGHLLHPRSAVREGDRVRVRILHLDAAARRLGLTLRDVPQSDLEGDAEPSSDERERVSSF